MFHLGRRPNLTDFSPEDGTLTPCKGGYILVFKFVRVNGVSRQLHE